MQEEKQLGLTFPCEFPVKAIGRHTEDFVAIVTEIVLRHAPDMAADAVSSRNSAGGRYLAVTATITATSREQLDNLYRELSGHEQVLWVL